MPKSPAKGRKAKPDPQSEEIDIRPDLSPEADLFTVHSVERDKPKRYLRCYRILLKEWNKEKLLSRSLYEEFELIAYKEETILRLKNRFSKKRGEPYSVYPKRDYKVPPPDSGVWGDVPPEERFQGEETCRILTPLWMVLHYFDEAPEDTPNSMVLRIGDDSNVDRMTRGEYYKLIKSTAERFRLELTKLGHGIWRSIEEQTLPSDSCQYEDYLLRVQRKIAQLESPDFTAEVSKLSSFAEERQNAEAIIEISDASGTRLNRTAQRVDPTKGIHEQIADGKRRLDQYEEAIYALLLDRHPKLMKGPEIKDVLTQHFDGADDAIDHALRRMKKLGIIDNRRRVGYYLKDYDPAPIRQ